MVTDTNANLAHPLDPLTAREIKLAADTVRAFMAKGQFEGAPASPLFNSISLLEPPKYDILRWAGTFTPKELAAVGAEPKPITRQADVSFAAAAAAADETRSKPAADASPRSTSSATSRTKRSSASWTFRRT